MTKLTSQEKSVLQGMISSPQWKVIDYLREEYVRMLKDKPKKRMTIDETVITTLTDEGMVQGINDFFSELWKQAQK